MMRKSQLPFPWLHFQCLEGAAVWLDCEYWEGCEKGRTGAHSAIWPLLNQLSSNQLFTMFGVLTLPHSVDALAHRVQMCYPLPLTTKLLEGRSTTSYFFSTPNMPKPSREHILLGNWPLLDSQRVPFKLECSGWIWSAGCFCSPF